MLEIAEYHAVSHCNVTLMHPKLVEEIDTAMGVAQSRLCLLPSLVSGFVRRGCHVCCCCARNGSLAALYVLDDLGGTVCEVFCALFAGGVCTRSVCQGCHWGLVLCCWPVWLGFFPPCLPFWVSCFGFCSHLHA